MSETLILTRRWGKPDSAALRTYRADGGYAALDKALGMEPAAIVDEVKRSNLRGRGGAGFATGLKWTFLPKDIRPRYLTVNADESEPGTFKDRYIIEHDPHMLIEGIAITCYALDIHLAYVYIRGEFARQARILEAAIEEARAAGILGQRLLGKKDFDLDVFVHRGAGAYICGEESALLESLEGKKGYPRLKPPFPAVVGLWGKPTIINNVETIANVPWIVANGGDAFAGLGVGKSGGTRLFGVSGHVNRPGVFEKPVDYNLKKLIMEDCGGIPGGRKVKAVIPGGSSSPVLRGDEIDISLEFDAVKAAGSMSGSGGVIVFDDSTCMVRALARISKFYAEESCGQCTPCREGTSWMEGIVEKIEHGHGTAADVAKLEQIAGNIGGQTICALGDAASMPVQSFVKKFRDEFLRHVEERRCPFGDHGWGLDQSSRPALVGGVRY
ncbi:NADH-quinone oxidoreductase subunit NuoF [Anaeromyxobacter sp. Fw109-5]|uniref:NADH-quinone oxidoreductase subunit NuoF n=1 Tax=Anaeromyxobacter sp. (strain Fw109-5) TaxID=404589 RepID=UPI0000ED6D29|nr:NADH-quinone oxidoreductase subunit NuoF [Anaeromyxobacter sp. Fw109-5]ABS28526.1 NADH-quinone oxidoreductase, F subunit [Anaeromyxobacter sp. Fw109-5]